MLLIYLTHFGAFDSFDAFVEIEAIINFSSIHTIVVLPYPLSPFFII